MESIANERAAEDHTVRQRATLILWGVAIVLLPFFQFPYLFKKLSLYPLIGILLLNIDRWWNLFRDNRFLRWTALALAAFFLWQFASLPLAMNISEISLAKNIRPIIGEIVTYGAWYVLMAACFFFSREKIGKVFYWSLTIILGYCSLYCVIELLHLHHVKLATDFLSKSIYYFMADIGKTNGWWPPVFFGTRLRSVFAEPSFFAVLLVFSILYFGFCAWQEEEWKKILRNILLMLLAAALCFGAKSGSANVTLGAATLFFLLLLAIFFRKFSPEQKIKGGMLALLLVLLSALLVINPRGRVNDTRRANSGQLAGEQLLATQSGSTESRMIHLRNDTRRANSGQLAGEQLLATQSDSTGGRMIHLKSELQLIAQKPLIGVGEGNHADAMREALLKNPQKTGETRLWSENLDGKVPVLNKYTGIAVQNGLIGLLLFLAVFGASAIACVKSRKTMAPERWIASLVLCGSIALILCSVSCCILYHLGLLTAVFYGFIREAVPGSEEK